MSVEGHYPDSFAEELVACGLLREEERQEAQREQQTRGGRLCDILVEKGYVTERTLLGCFARVHHIPPVSLESLQIEAEVLELVPEKVATYYKAVPVGRAGNYLTVAMVDPLNVFALDDLALITSLKIIPVVALASEIQATLERHYHQTEQFEEIIATIEGSEDISEAQIGPREVNLDQLREEPSAPVVKLVNLILTQAIDERASDIHFEPFERKVVIRNRIDGVLYERSSPPPAMYRAILSRLKVMAQLDIAEHRLPQDGRFRIRTRGREVDFRVSTLPTAYGEKVVLRVLDKGMQAMDIDRLGLDAASLERFKQALDAPHGMIFVTGPTGSGKTTTLYACLQRLNTPRVNIVTIEDPIEYQFPGINQVNVNPDVGLTFAAGLRSILRQDPDIIMVGEVRDTETADIAVKAALTGHLVLTTLHTNDAASTFARLVDMGVEPYLIASAVNLVAAQRLCRRLCTRCKRSVTIDPGVLERAQFRLGAGQGASFCGPVGCQYCRNTGYAGRLALIEVLTVTEAMRRMIMTNREAMQIKQLALAEGMQSLRQCGLARAAEGITSLEEVLRVTTAD
ncbi:MAG: type IV-A pilus assembly ATPase PilB [bacterium]|nr:type IV-A pilus assembly ATPase PilB [bacterium]